MNSRIREIGISGIIGVFIATAPLIFQFFVVDSFEEESQKILFEKVPGEFVWKANTDSLPAGDYYVSVGRPRGNCDLNFDGHIVDSTRSPYSNFRTSLTLGSALRITPQISVSKVTISCQEQFGFSSNLTHKPIVTRYFVGMTLQLWRSFSVLLLAPLCGLWLLATTLTVVPNRAIQGAAPVKMDLAASDRTRDTFTYLVFSLISIFYSVSLAHFPRLFMSEEVAYTSHVLLRHAFSLAYLEILMRYTGRSKTVYALFIASATLTTIVYFSTPHMVHSFYKIQYLLFVISSVVGTGLLFLIPTKSYSLFILRGLALAWSISQILDFVNLWTSIGAYNAPVVLAALTLSFSYLRKWEGEKSIRLGVAIARISRHIRSDSSLREILAQPALVAGDESKLVRISTYIDMFALGEESEPLKKLERVSELGYSKNTDKDKVIEVNAGRGLLMVEALKSRNSIIKIGRDKAWFVVVPLGRFACINLSDDRPRSAHLAYESLSAMETLRPALESLEEKIRYASIQSRLAINRLRTTRGLGTQEEFIGAVFVDVAQFSVYCEKFKEAFVTFFSEKYLPALIRSASEYLTPEFTRGDEVYFCCLGELLGENVKIEEAIHLGVVKLLEFSSFAGARMCLEEGFQPLKIRVGANVGFGSVVVTEMEVKTLGHVVNSAKRLQEDARPNSPLVSLEISKFFSEKTSVLGERHVVLVKETKVIARAVTLKVAGI